MTPDWNYHVDIQGIEKELFQKFQDKITGASIHIMKLLNCGLQKHKVNSEIKNCNNYTELKSIIEKNKQLKIEIDTKLEELTKSQAQYEIYKKDRRLLRQEVKETHEAFLMAKKYYKKFLKIYYTIESTGDKNQIIFVQFFTESKRETENYSVRLKRNVETGHYELTDMTPKVKTFTEIQKKLADSNDISGALCFIRQMFLKLKQNK